MTSTLLQDATFMQIRDFIYEKCGIFIPDSKKYLIETRLSKSLQERSLAGFEDYLHFLRFSSNGNELSKLFDAVTTNETFFFRELQQLQVFNDSVVPKIMEKNGSRSIRIWSAACSTGEEPYTLGMMLAGKWPGISPNISASDISDKVLESAKKAVYGSYSVRNVPPEYLKKYFKVEGQTYRLDGSVKNYVRFMNINLMDDKKIRMLSGMDAVFCRNVLIYFDDKAKQKTLSSIYDCLKPGGVLFLGASESLHNVTRAFKPVIINKVVVYEKA